MRYLAVAALALVLSIPAAAQENDISAACDTKTLCPGVKGGGRILDCLGKNIESLDQSCLSTLGRQWLTRRMQEQAKRAAKGQAPAGAPPAGTSAPSPGAAPPAGTSTPAPQWCDFLASFSADALTLANCPKVRSASIHDRCRAVFESFS
jgi:hypothetical protein